MRPRAAYAGIMRRLAWHAGLRVFRMFVRRLRADPVDPPAGLLDCRFMTEDQVLALCEDGSLELAGPKVQAAYGRGDLCVGAFDGGQLAGYCWFAFSATPQMDGLWLDFPSELVYTYKSYVRPPFRGRGLAASLYRFADRACLERGRSHAVISVESHNWSSIAAAQRGGFGAAGYAAYIGEERLRAWWCSRTAADYGLRLCAPA